MPYHHLKIFSAAAVLAILSGCASEAPKPAEPPTTSAPRDCDQPGQRDDQGRPIPLC